MALFDRFKKKPDKDKKVDLKLKKKETEKRRKEQEEEKKKKMFQAVPGVGKEVAKEVFVKTPKKESVKEIRKRPEKKDTGDAYKILIKPIITEKMTNLTVNNKYGFLVSNQANKQQIKEAITMVYGVAPLKVHIINIKGKEVKTGKITGRTKNRKKAIITLKPGEKIEIYETVKS